MTSCCFCWVQDETPQLSRKIEPIRTTAIPPRPVPTQGRYLTSEAPSDHLVSRSRPHRPQIVNMAASPRTGTSNSCSGSCRRSNCSDSCRRPNCCSDTCRRRLSCHLVICLLSSDPVSHQNSSLRRISGISLVGLGSCFWVANHPYFPEPRSSTEDPSGCSPTACWRGSGSCSTGRERKSGAQGHWTKCRKLNHRYHWVRLVR